MQNLKRTPLTDWHEAHGAKMGPFAGFAMPIQYTGIIAEHEHTRTKASIFDICHMGEFLVRGPGAADALGRTVTHNLKTLPPGKCRYGFMLNETGGVLDDLIVYCLGADDYMLVVNGACEDQDFAWIAERLPADVTLQNVSDATAKIDLQGPTSIDALETALGAPWRHLKYFNFESTEFDGAALKVSRTGYTGELGYELYLPADKAPALWERLAGIDGVAPAGLGARDTLRLECGYPLYGQDLDAEHTPVEAGYGFLMTSETDFVGKDTLGTVREQLVALTVPGRRSPRQGDAVTTRDGKEVGRVTSGSFSPSLAHCIALAYVKAQVAEVKDFLIQGARSELCATRADLPFYTGGTARMQL